LVDLNMDSNKMAQINTQKIIFPELSYAITGMCFAVHNEIGRFAREKQYGNLLEQRLRLSNVPFKRESRIPKNGNIIDFVIDNKIILELKSTDIISKTDYYQVQRYLHALNLKLGLLVNFRNRYLKPIRILNPEVSL